MRVRIWLGCTSLFLLLAGLPAAALASPRGWRGERGGFREGGAVRIYRSFPGYYYWGTTNPFWGWDWGWYPWYYEAPEVNVPRGNYGIVAFDVKPKDSKVYVDHRYLGTVNELSGRHHEADLPSGYHSIRIVVSGRRAVERTIYLAAGQKVKFKQHF